MDAKNLVGTKIDGKYVVSRVIGAGGMGAVYEAHHVGTGRRVAIKVISTGDLSKDEQLVGRFQREARAAGAVDTQHICQVLDTGTDPTTHWPFMVMEFMHGEDVQQLLRRVGPTHPDLALRIAAQACVGLSKAHEAGVVHRDIKPANLYLARTDASRVIVKLLDFGIAKVKMEHASEMGDAGLTRTGTMLGSPLYMSPEQARGMKTIDHRADIWSLGVVLYEMLTGRTPYHHIEALGELIIAICSEVPAPVQDYAPWVPPEVAALVHKALKQNPADRFQSANEMLEAVRALQPDMEIDESQLVSLSETQRNLVAKRLTLPPPAAGMAMSNVPAQSVPPPPLMPSGLTQSGGGTTGAVALPTERTPARQKSNVPMIIAGAALSVAVFGVVAYKVIGTKEAPPAQAAVTTSEPTSEPTTTITVAPTGVAPAGTTAIVTPSQSAPVERKEVTVRLPIDPENATVTIDGKPAKLVHGIVEITGMVGDIIKVKIAVGKEENDPVDVVIAATGPMPPRLKFVKPTVGGTGPKPATSDPKESPSAKPPPSKIEKQFGD